MAILRNGFQVLLKDEAGQTGVKIVDDVVSMQHSTTHPVLAPAKSGERIQFQWHFDFENVSRSELMELASRSLVITMRAPFKNLEKPEPADWNDARFKIREWIDEQKRKPQDKVAKARKALESLSDEEKKAILASLLSNNEKE